MSKDLQNKILLTSVDRSQLPNNLKSYLCDLIIEQDIQTSKSRKYLVFKHKQNKQAPFKIILSSFKKPSNLMHVYNLENQKFSLKGKVDRVGESRVQKKLKQFKFKQVGSDEEDQYVQKKITFGDQSSEMDSDQYDNSSQSSSQAMAPTDQIKPKIKNAMIEILNKRGKIASIKDLNTILKKQYKFKIPQNSAKQIAFRICNSDKKSKGYVLKPEYVDEQQRMQGTKRVKYD